MGKLLNINVDSWLAIFADKNHCIQLDVTDPYQHYGMEVPCQALSSPVLRFAILALALCHLGFVSSLDKIETLQYHSKSLQLLIPALLSPDNHNDDVLAATVIL